MGSYTLPIIAERNGYVKYLDLKQGVSFRESIDDTKVSQVKLLSTGVKIKSKI